MDRMLTVQFMKPDKTIVWLTIPWGKAHLDYYRNKGWIILMTV